MGFTPLPKSLKKKSSKLMTLLLIFAVVGLGAVSIIITTKLLQQKKVYKAKAATEGNFMCEKGGDAIFEKDGDCIKRRDGGTFTAQRYWCKNDPNCSQNKCGENQETLNNVDRVCFAKNCGTEQIDAYGGDGANCWNLKCYGDVCKEPGPTHTPTPPQLTETPTPPLSPTPTIPTIPSNTPTPTTIIPTTTLTPTPILTTTPSPSPTPGPTSTPGPSATPTPGPSAIPGPGPSNTPPPPPSGILNCFDKGCSNDSNPCKSGMTCISTPDGPYCSLSELVETCRFNPTFDNCCKIPTTPVPTVLVKATTPSLLKTGITPYVVLLVPVILVLLGLFL